MHLREISIEDFSLEELPAGKSTLRLTLFYFRDGTRLGVPMAVIKGGEPATKRASRGAAGEGSKGAGEGQASEGPRVCVLATQHGDEWNGSLIIHTLFQRLSTDGFKGTLVLLPIANPPAFIEKNRVSRVDGVDMNRVYQFFKGHRPTEQLAKHLFDAIFSKMEYVIDLHSGGPGEYLPNAGCLRSRVGLAEAFGFGHVITAEDKKREEFIRHSGGLVPACERLDIAGFVLEIGRGRCLQRGYAERGVAGLTNFLRAVGAVPEPVVEPGPHNIYIDKLAVKSPIPGIFDPIVGLADNVEEGQLLGKVTALLAQESYEAFAPQAGTVIYMRREEMVAEGESLYHIAWS